MANLNPEQLAGETIGGHYALLKAIGNGGYGVVYRAVDLHNNHDYALKVLKALDQKSWPLAKQAIQREATVYVNHPNIASPIDGGEHVDHPYVVSELAAGQTVESALSGGWVPGDAVIANVLSQSLAAADACHAAGIIHRDLSARNILIDRDSLHLRVIDFGSVYRQNDPAQLHEAYYHVTPGIIPPEMLGSNCLTPNPQQDLFAIGVLGYQMLAGDTPYQGSTPDEVKQAISVGACTPIQQLIPTANPDLVSIVDKLMAHQMAERYAFAADAMNALSQTFGITNRHAATSAHQQAGIARCSYCGHRSAHPVCKTCGRKFVPGIKINLWESMTAVHSTYFIAEGDHAFGRKQIDPRDRTISRQQIVLASGSGHIRLHDGGSVNPSTIQGTSPGGLIQPGTTLFTFGRFTGHLINT